MFRRSSSRICAASSHGPKIVGFAEGEKNLDWIEMTEAIAQGHALPKAQIADSFLSRKPDTLLSRAAWIDGMGSLVKTATVFPNNPSLDRGLPAVHGGVCLYSDTTGQLEAIIDFHLVTKWKTAADSLLAARRLAPQSVNNKAEGNGEKKNSILIIGAGPVGASMIEAYSAAFPNAEIKIWNRSMHKAEALVKSYADKGKNVDISPLDLGTAVGAAGVICCATMVTEPILKGAWLSEGTHIDLIGAYKLDMREADDDVWRRCDRLFLDSRETVLGHIGEITTPMREGIIKESNIVADYYDGAVYLTNTNDEGKFKREDESHITVCKNGGGAHLDLMVARHILEKL